jgi:prepilin-type N-terminal cleavage/methylation domain-containing protein
MNALNMRKPTQGGFSLVEILVVLVIMGLLISVVAPTVLNRADDARVGKVYADYLFLSPGDNRDVDIYSLGADGVSGGEDQNADIGNWKAED